jgi:N-acetylmuramoyl-L-alanine amidase
VDEPTSPRARRAHAAKRPLRRRIIVSGAAGVCVAVVLVLVFAHVASPRPTTPTGPAATGADPSSPPASTTGTALDPSVFTPGSCVAFSPSSGDNHKTVFIDAGHGGIDPGAVGVTEAGKTIHEADETLPVALDATTILRAAGYRVVDSRTRQTVVRRLASGDASGGIFTVAGEDREIASRDICANDAKANVLVAIYFDAGGSSSDAGSVTAYDTVRSFSSESKRLATLVQRDVLASLNAHGWGIPNDGVMSDVSLGGPPLSSGGAHYGHLMVLGPAMAGYFTTPSEMPGALIEPLFITDPFEGTIANSSVGQHAIAQGLAKAVEQYFG